MDACASLNELLYIVSNYEKGRIKTSGFWSNKYRRSLYDSLRFMDDVINLLLNPKKADKEVADFIYFFITKNTMIIFPQSDLHINQVYDMIMQLSLCQLNTADRIVLYQMKNIVSDCICLINDKKTGYKTYISYLLKALHNFPRVFMTSSKHTLYGIHVGCITAEEAMKYASSYLRAIEGK